jgi:hypothetical protein
VASLANIGESSGGWVTLAIVLAVLAGLTFFALRKPGGRGGKGGFGPLGTFGGKGDDGLGRGLGGGDGH